LKVDICLAIFVMCRVATVVAELAAEIGAPRVDL